MNTNMRIKAISDILVVIALILFMLNTYKRFDQLETLLRTQEAMISEMLNTMQSAKADAQPTKETPNHQ